MNVIFLDLIAVTIGKGNVVTRRQPMLHSLSIRRPTIGNHPLDLPTGIVRRLKPRVQKFNVGLITFYDVAIG